MKFFSECESNNDWSDNDQSFSFAINTLTKKDHEHAITFNNSEAAAQA